MLEALARRPHQVPPYSPSVAPPPSHPHPPGPPAPPALPRPALATKETRHVEASLAETAAEEPHARSAPPPPSRPAPSPPSRPAPPPPPRHDRRGGTTGVPFWRGNSPDQKSREENLGGPSSEPSPAPPQQRAAGGSHPTEGGSAPGRGSLGSGHSATTKSAGSGGRGGAGPGGGGGSLGPAQLGSLDLHGIRGAELGWRGAPSPAEAPHVPPTSPHKWSPRRANQSVSAKRLPQLLPPGGGETRPAQVGVTQAPGGLPAAAAPGITAPPLGPAGGGASGGLGLDGWDTTSDGKKKEKNITLGERREKNMVQATPAWENGVGNLRPIMSEGGGEGEGRGGGDKGERGDMEKRGELPLASEPLPGLGRDETRVSRGGHPAAAWGGPPRPQAGKRKRLLKRDSEPAGQSGAAGRGAGQQESRGQHPPMAPRGTLQEGPPAAAVPLPPAAAAPRHARPGTADEAREGGAPGGMEAPPWVAPIPGAGDPPPRQHVAPGGADYSYLPPGFDKVDTSEGCQCWQTHDDSLTLEEECHCRGRHVTTLPANLSASMDRL